MKPLAFSFSVAVLASSLASAQVCVPPVPGRDIALARAVGERLTKLQAAGAAGAGGVVLEAFDDGCRAGAGTGYRVSKAGRVVFLDRYQFLALTRKGRADDKTARDLAAMLGIAAAPAAAASGPDAKIAAREAAAAAAGAARARKLLADPFDAKRDDAVLAPPPRAAVSAPAPASAPKRAPAAQAPKTSSLLFGLWSSPKSVPAPAAPAAEPPPTAEQHVGYFLAGLGAVAIGVVALSAGGIAATGMGAVIVIGGAAYAGYHLWGVLKPLRDVGSLLEPPKS